MNRCSLLLLRELQPSCATSATQLIRKWLRQELNATPVGVVAEVKGANLPDFNGVAYVAEKALWAQARVMEIFRAENHRWNGF